MYTSWTFRIDVGKRAATVDGKAIFVRHVDLVTELKLNSVLSEKVCGRTNFEIEAKEGPCCKTEPSGRGLGSSGGWEPLGYLARCVFHSKADFSRCRGKSYQ